MKNSLSFKALVLTVPMLYNAAANEKNAFANQMNALVNAFRR